MTTRTAISIRFMVRRDYGACAVIDRQSGHDARTEDDLSRLLRGKVMGGHVATDSDDRPVGYLVYECHRRHYTLVALAVSPEHQRQGIGTMLVRRLKLRLARCLEHDQITVMVRETNLPMLCLLRRSGFRARCVERAWFRDTGEDGIRMAYAVETAVEREEMAVMTIVIDATQSRTLHSCSGGDGT